MKIAEAQRVARGLLDQHDLRAWRLRIDNARQRCGACHFSSREITLSRHFIALNEIDQVRDTVLHEIAHAIAGPDNGHGRRWQTVARRIGAPVSATNATATMPAPPWLLQCLSCARTVARRHRRSLDLKRARCGHCGMQHGKLQWVRDQTMR